MTRRDFGLHGILAAIGSALGLSANTGTASDQEAKRLWEEAATLTPQELKQHGPVLDNKWEPTCEITRPNYYTRRVVIGAPKGWKFDGCGCEVDDQKETFTFTLAWKGKEGNVAK